MDKDTIEITKEIEEIIEAENHIKELLAAKRLEELRLRRKQLDGVSPQASTRSSVSGFLLCMKYHKTVRYR